MLHADRSALVRLAAEVSSWELGLKIKLMDRARDLRAPPGDYKLNKAIGLPKYTSPVVSATLTITFHRRIALLRFLWCPLEPRIPLRPSCAAASARRPGRRGSCSRPLRKKCPCCGKRRNRA